MAPRKVLEDTANRLIDAYETYTLEAFLSVRSADCVNLIIPASAGVPVMNNDQYSEFFRPMMDVIRNFRLRKVSMMVDAEQNQVMMHMKSSADSDLGPYRGEYIITLTMTEDGSKVKRFEEFLDVALAQQYTMPLRAHALKKEKAKRSQL